MTARVEGLGAGVYAVTVTNGNECELIRFITIDDPPSVDIETSATDMTCPDSNDGKASVEVIGGTTPYTYAWSNGGDTREISGLAQGVYRVTVTDAN
ncbi:SprB repeat-containing protein, partial [Arthrospira platensis SPKY1]|nr:SprB repeat-containing protein [Arthrospira platensis SPKY1]